VGGDVDEPGRVHGAADRPFLPDAEGADVLLGGMDAIVVLVEGSQQASAIGGVVEALELGSQVLALVEQGLGAASEICEWVVAAVTCSADSATSVRAARRPKVSTVGEVAFGAGGAGVRVRGLGRRRRWPGREGYSAGRDAGAAG
jgi:hypothetical protein